MVIGLTLSLTIPPLLKAHFNEFVNGPDGRMHDFNHVTQWTAELWGIEQTWLHEAEAAAKRSGDPTVLVGVSSASVPTALMRDVSVAKKLSIVIPTLGVLPLLWAATSIRKRSHWLRVGLIILSWSAVLVVGIKYLITYRWLHL
jgi:hypothetical protein